MLKPALLIVLLTLGIVVLAACEDEAVDPTPRPSPTATATPIPSPTPTPTPTYGAAEDIPPPAQIIQSAVVAMETAGTLHFDLEGEITVPTGDTETSIPVSFVGDMQMPDRLGGKVTLSVAFFTLEAESIVIGDTSYTTDLLTQEWKVAPGLASALPSPLDLLSENLSALEGVEFVGVESLDGWRVFHIRGTLPEGSLGDNELGFDVWIDLDDMLVRQAAVGGQVSLESLGNELESVGISGTARVAVTIKFSGHGEPVEIIAPALPTGLNTGVQGRHVPEMNRLHVKLGQAHPPYNSVPATSGWHYGQPYAPAPWGVHTVTFVDEVLVHNLEHGGIGVHYSCPDGCAGLVEQLAEFVNRAVNKGDKFVMSPYPGMDTRFALTAWTYIDRFDELDLDRLAAFAGAHMNSPNSPEPLAR